MLIGVNTLLTQTREVCRQDLAGSVHAQTNRLQRSSFASQGVVRRELFKDTKSAARK